MSGLLAVNIGNSRVTLAEFELPAAAGTPQLALAASFPSPGTADFSPQFEPEHPVEAVVVCSVNPPCDAAVIRWLRQTFSVEPLHFPSDVPPPIENRSDAPEAVGADRLANATAAYDEFHRACVIVDAGTAVTVDAVSADGAFLGGAILPGIALWARALARGPALLPELSVKGPGPAIGRSTPSAISSGTLRGLAGAVDRLTADIAEELGGSEHIVLTGGDAPHLAGLCRTRMHVRPNLTLAGLALAYARHSESL